MRAFYIESWDIPTNSLKEGEQPPGTPEIGAEEPHFILRGVPFN